MISPLGQTGSHSYCKSYVSIDFWETGTYIDRDWQLERLGDVFYIVKLPTPTVWAQGTLFSHWSLFHQSIQTH